MQRQRWSELSGEIRALLSSSREKRELFNALDAVASALREAGVSDHVYISSRLFGETIFEADVKHSGSLDSSDRRTTQISHEGNFPTDLCYANIPLGLILRNATEIFSATNNWKPAQITQPHVHLAPLKLLYQGDFFGVFESLDYLAGAEAPPPSPWQMNAGARSFQFSFSFHNRKINSAANQARQILGIPANPNGDAQTAHFEILKGLVRTIDPDWAVTFALFPEQWLYEESVDRATRARLETALFRTGWNQAQPLMKNDDSRFLSAWSSFLKVRALPSSADASLGKFAYNLFKIDKCLQPCLVDVRSTLNSLDYGKLPMHHLESRDAILDTGLFGSLNQLMPVADILVFATLTAHFHGLSRYATILAPAYIEPGVGSYFLSFAREPDVHLPADDSDRLEFLGRLMALLGRRHGSRQCFISEPNRINPESITLIGGASRGDVRGKQGAVKPVMLDIYDLDRFKSRPENHCQHRLAQYPIELDWLLTRLWNGNVPKIPEDSIRFISESHQLVDGFGRDGLSFHIRFRTRG